MPDKSHTRIFDYGMLSELAHQHPDAAHSAGKLSRLYNAETGQIMSKQACKYIMRRYPELFPPRRDDA